MSIAAIYECPACAARIPADRPLWRCDCGSHLNLAPGPGLVRGEIAAGEASLWRYRAALALRDPPRVSLGEGWTPLVERRWDGAPVLFKLESQMPTGSFKDRGTAVMLNHLIEVGVARPASTRIPRAMPARRSRPTPPRPGFACRIYVPATAPRGKIVQIAASGAEVRAIPGTRQDVTEAALRGGRRKLLRQPQLAAVLYRGHQDAGLRAVGAARLPRAGQHPGADRLRQQHPRPRPRLRRTRTQRRDRPPAAPFRRAGRELRRLRRRLGRPAPTITSRSRPPRPPPTASPRVKPVRTREVLRALRRSGGARRRGAGSRDRPGARGARPPRPVCRADRRDRRRRPLAAAARRHDPRRTKPRSPS